MDAAAELIALAARHLQLFTGTVMQLIAVGTAAGGANIAGGDDGIILDDDCAEITAQAGAPPGNSFCDIQIVIDLIPALHGASFCLTQYDMKRFVSLYTILLILSIKRWGIKCNLMETAESWFGRRPRCSPPAFIKAISAPFRPARHKMATGFYFSLTWPAPCIKGRIMVFFYRVNASSSTWEVFLCANGSGRT